MASSKLRFKVVSCSGEDPDYAVKQLEEHGPHTRGWQSPRFCEYPQEVTVRFDSGAKTRITQVQLLSHQSKIATKIELYVGDAQDPSSASWSRLGYLSLDSNERSNYQARELKSVYVNAVGGLLRFVIHKCFINKCAPGLSPPSGGGHSHEVVPGPRASSPRAPARLEGTISSIK